MKRDRIVVVVALFDRQCALVFDGRGIDQIEKILGLVQFRNPRDAGDQILHAMGNLLDRADIFEQIACAEQPRERFERHKR